MEMFKKELPWCTLVATTEAVTFQTRWQYNWRVGGPNQQWAWKEKRDFHARAERHIVSTWSRARLEVSGASKFSKRVAGKSLPLVIDIRWVLAAAHWTVNVKKIPADHFEASHILWEARRINLDTNDFSQQIRCLPKRPSCHKQRPVAHEFGHVFGNSAYFKRGDEYASASPHRFDHASIMNIGNQLRGRHFETIIGELNALIPETKFKVKL